jgi:hypothetical protein
LVCRERTDAVALCGEPLVAHLPAEAGPHAGLQMIGSDESEAEPSGGRFGELADGEVGVVWHWSAPGPPGVYRITRGRDVVYSLAVAVPAEESTLDSLPPEVLKGRLAGGRPLYCHNAAGAGQRRDDIWKWFVVACAVCMLAELTTLLAFRT